MRSTVFAFAAAGMLIAGPSYGACTKSEPPACATQGGAFAGEADFDRCRIQMLAYRDGTEKFATCLKDEGKAADEQAARDEFESILSRFNRRARGEAG